MGAIFPAGVCDFQQARRGAVPLKERTGATKHEEAKPSSSNRRFSADSRVRQNSMIRGNGRVRDGAVVTTPPLS